jgi:hypothetical protein
MVAFLSLSQKVEEEGGVASGQATAHSFTFLQFIEISSIYRAAGLYQFLLFSGKF